jgi:predicted secreted protein
MKRQQRRHRKSNPIELGPVELVLGITAVAVGGAALYALLTKKPVATPSPILSFSVPGQTLQLGPSDSGSTYNVTVGQQVVISVPNAPTGYSWNLTATTGTNVMGQASGDSSGSNLTETYTVQAPGTQTIFLTQVDINGNINSSAAEYTYSFNATAAAGGSNGTQTSSAQ